LTVQSIDDLPRMGMELLMPDVAELKQYAILNPDNKDPFDDTLTAVAISEKCTFVTADPKILAMSLQDLSLLDATK
jgi:PIN domain nuclease of toxin-antitoxin system